MTELKVNHSIQFQVLNEAQCLDILDATYSVMENTGYTVGNERARKILHDAGCIVEGVNVKIPKHIVEKALSTSPSKISIYNREGQPVLDLDSRSGNSHFCAGILNSFRISPYTGKRELTVKRDVTEAGLVIEALPNVDVACGLAYITDCNQALADVYELRLLLETTSKPIVTWTDNTNCIRTKLDMCAEVAGSIEKLREKPFIIFGQSGLSPLSHPDEVLERFMNMVESGLPTHYIGAPMLGASSPVTLAGNLVVGLADCLIGLVVSQLINENSPFIAACFNDCMDMKTMICTETNPEFVLCSAAAGDIFRYLNLPYILHLGCTDSPLFDQQAAFDISTQLYTAILNGSNLNYFLGYLESAMSSSLEMLVYGNEAIGFLRRIKKGIEISAETLAVDVIAEVGPGGAFLSHDHTFNNYTELWQPDSFVRTTYDKWSGEGKKDFYTRANEIVLNIISAGPRNPLSTDILNKLDSLLEEAEEKLTF